MKITQPSPSETENQFDIKFHEFNDNYDLAEEDPEKAKELFFIEINNKKKNYNIYKNDPIKAQKLVLDILEQQINHFEKHKDTESIQACYLLECHRIIGSNGYCV